MIPRRSVLYLPGANARALEKARSLDCDGIIFDLEDAIAPARKADARAQVVHAIASGGYGSRELVVRVNALDSPWGRDDLTAAAGLKIDAVLLPKVECADAVTGYIEALDTAGGSDVPVWLMIETPRAVLNVTSIAAASARTGVLVLGTSDLIKEMRARHTVGRENLGFALQSCVLAARAEGLDVLDGVHLEFRDDDAFKQACGAARDMGFDGKTLIHPRQIDVANEVFGIAESEIGHARRVLEAWQNAQSHGSGVAELDGRLIENLHAAEAERVLEFAAAVRARRAQD